jgi:pimeloyl-ACP methyl ester carboxylesterase
VHRTELGDLVVLEAGAGRPLLYLHGVGDGGGMIPAIARLARRRRVVRPDHPGFLRSDAGEFRSVRELAAWYARRIDEWELHDIDLVGCSLGGWIAAELALLRPAEVATLTLVDPAGLAAGERQPDIFSLPADAAIELTFATEEFRRTAREQPPGSETSRLLQRSREAAARIAGEPRPMHDPSLAARLEGIVMPTRIIWGADDGIIPVEALASWGRAVPGAETTVIPDAGHLPHVEQPSAFLAAVPHLVA